MTEHRSKLMKCLQEITCGDETSAELLLLNLVSKVYSRVDSIPLGAFNMNLYTLDKDLITEIHNNISTLYTALIPNQLNFPITLETMNKIALVPKKNYEKNQLEGGLLQIKDGTHVIFDEINLEEGNFEGEVPMLNIKAITQLVEEQQISYNFQYHETQFNVSAPTLIISFGRSLFKNCNPMPLKKVEEVSLELNQALTDVEIKGFQSYIQKVKNSEEQFSISPDAS